MERTEAAAEGAGRTDGAEEGAAGEGGGGEAGEVREAEEDLSELVVVESTYGGGSGWDRVLRRRRRRRRVGSHGCRAQAATDLGDLAA